MFEKKMQNTSCNCKGKYIHEFQAGGFAHVYLIKCKYCHKLFVLKQLRTNINTLQGLSYKEKKIKLKQALLKEYHTGIALNNHPYIIQTLDYNIDKKNIKLEYFHGEDLFDILTLKCKQTRSLLYVFSQLLDAVAYMHNLGIAHMDIKLENILVNTSLKTIKLVDFGQSCLFKNGNSTNHAKYNGLKGTYTYLAPEMCKNLEYDPEKIDVWCCGIVLYNIVYNKVPWLIANESKDLSFNSFIKDFRSGYLCPNIFPSLKQYEYNNTEEQILYNVFWFALNPDPEYRLSISELQMWFNQLKK